MTAARTDDPAERWPADSGADPWAAYAATDTRTGGDALGDRTAGDALGDRPGNGTSPAAENGNGSNGFTGFPDYGGEAGWPPPAEPVHAGTPEHHDLDHGDAEFADADSLPRRVRQASLAPQLRENTLYAQPSANGDSTPAADTPDERSPEEARSTITAIQRGWERGRSLFDPPEKTTETMTGTQPAAEPSPPAAGEAGDQGDE